MMRQNLNRIGRSIANVKNSLKPQKPKLIIEEISSTIILKMLSELLLIN